MRRLILLHILFLAFFFTLGAAYWYCAHHLSWGWFAGFFVVGQLVRVALFSGESS